MPSVFHLQKLCLNIIQQEKKLEEKQTKTELFETIEKRFKKMKKKIIF